MGRAKVTLSLPGSVADYLRSQPNASAVVAEAVAIYRTRELEEILARAYREDASESRELHEEWSAVDSEVDG